MLSTARKSVVTVAALGALALGGSAIAGAAQSNSSSSTQGTQAAAQGQPPNGAPPGGRHVGANGKREQALTGETAAKVKAAALKKVAGGTVERVETDVDHGSPYEAHVTKSDGTQVEVLVDKDFQVTAVNEMRRP
jgi:uncharacterized membrane protein YkoI